MSLYSDLILSDGPALYWRLGSGGATDQSGNGRDGTAVGGVTIGGGAGLLSGDADGSTQFDGSDDRITSTYSPFVNGTVRTFEGWAYRDTATTIDVLFGGTTASHPLLRVNSGTTSVSFFPSAAGAAVTWAAGTFPTATIVHWVLVFDEPNDVAELFINGVSQGTKATTVAYQSPVGNFMIGARATAGTDPFVGRIDEIAVYTRALTSAEIAEHYEAGTAKFGEASLSGAGDLAASATRGVVAAVPLTGAGTLTASGTRTRPAAAALAGTGSETATATRTAIAAAALTGSGTESITATDSQTLTASASLSGTGSLAASATRSTSGAAALTAAGDLTATATRAASGSAALAGAGTLAASALRSISAAAALTGAGSLAATGGGLQSASAALSGTAGLIAAGGVIRHATAALVGTSSLSADGRRIVLAAGALSGAGQINAAAIRIAWAVAALSGTSALTATGAATQASVIVPGVRAVLVASHHDADLWRSRHDAMLADSDFDVLLGPSQHDALIENPQTDAVLAR